MMSYISILHLYSTRSRIWKMISLENIDMPGEFGVLKNIKVDKSPQPDGIYPRLLREAREEIQEP